MKTKFIYQILLKGIATNKLILIDVYDVVQFDKMVNEYKSGKYNNLILLDTNIYRTN